MIKNNQPVSIYRLFKIFENKCSYPTLYKKIKEMENEGLITISIDNSGGRYKKMINVL